MNIVLIAGGFSAEREVSLVTGKSVLSALRENGHFVKVFDPVYGTDILNEEEIFQDKLSGKYPSKDHLSELKAKASVNLYKILQSDYFDGVDIAFIALHGKFGEDGNIQTLLDTKGIKYTGSGIMPSALAMDKHLSKVMFNHFNIPTPDWFIIKKNVTPDFDALSKKINNEISFPCVIKPNDEGSTVGLTILNDDNPSNLKKAVEFGFEYTNTLIVEKFIAGKEMTVSVIGNQAYPVIEVKPIDGFYDYVHKYSKGKTEYICPAVIPETHKNLMQNLAVRAFDALGCEVYGRVDFLLTDDGQALCLEVNTLPGMTSLSLVPKSAKNAGIDFNNLMEMLLNLSLNKYKFS